jgi:hypothetical protein
VTDSTTAGSTAGPEIRRFREVTAAVVGELRAAELRSTFAALSLEELVDQHISELEAGASTDPIKPARADRLKKVYDDFIGSLAAMKALPAETFVHRASSDNTSTPVEGTE